jgi:glycerol-3-phosphate dehydrogenase
LSVGAGSDIVDLLIVGGGINGAGIARDAVGRGLRVLLVEQDDLARATSSASTKLIHGGLRYLEHYEFRLVREALIEREVLLRLAPHIIWPLTFVLPHEAALRPAWMVRIGLFLYDHLGGREKLPGSRGLDLRDDSVGKPLQPAFTKGFSYADCWVDDARLVVLNALDARERGARILTRTRCLAARRESGLWHATIEDQATHEKQAVQARGLVNATGPWVASFLDGALGLRRPQRLRLVKGSHIVVRKLFEGPQAYILQNTDRRIVFAIPYERNYTLIGTTDVSYEGDPVKVAILPEEITYLCGVINTHFVKQIAPADVIWTYAGVRPLCDDEAADASAVTRDYVLELDNGSPPLLSVFGGKITTYRKLAEHALGKLKPYFPQSCAPWTHAAPLPGGDIAHGDFETFLTVLNQRWPWLPRELGLRYARAYGTRIERVLGGAHGIKDLGRHFGDDLYSREVEYLVEQEWAMTAEDVLWRRSKLGLHLASATVVGLGTWFNDAPMRPQAAARRGSP